MKNLIVLLIILLTFNACTKEDKVKRYEFTIINNSGENLTLSLLNQGTAVFTTDIMSTSSYFCSYTAEVNTLISECLQEGIDGIEIIFGNGTGYLCYMTNMSDNSLCFSGSKNPFNNDSYITVGNNQYEFIITEEDFNNAHELPE